MNELCGFGINSPLTNYSSHPREEPTTADASDISIMAEPKSQVSHRVRWLGYFQLSKPDAEPVGCVVTCSTCESKQLLLGRLGRSSEFREFLSSVAMFVAFVSSIPDSHRPVFAFLVN
jgi:hypothetical protein